MKTILTPIEVRVLGSLVEKAYTTPDSYPLTLNALTNACNQKTNREPVMDLSESTVLEAVESLVKHTLAAQRSTSGSRVPKYAHRLIERLTPEFDFSKGELAVLAVLFLRGAQTVGEIRIRCSRLHEFTDAAALESTLQKLSEREDGPYVVKLPVQPGRKEARYAHLVAGEVDVSEVAVTTTDTVALDDSQARIHDLEVKMQAMQKQIDDLSQKLNDFIAQFE